MDFTLRTPEAKRLADLAGIATDLRTVPLICDRLLAALGVVPTDWTLCAALTSAVLVRYARCFTTGVRERLPETVVDNFGEEMLKDHQMFLDLRDRLIAHSVNVLEENQVIAQLEGDIGSPVKDISVLERRLAAPSDEYIGRLKELSSLILSRVQQEMDAEKKRLSALIPQLSADKLSPGAIVRGHSSSDHDLARKVRKGF